MTPQEIQQILERHSLNVRIRKGVLEIDRGGYNSYADCIFQNWKRGPQNEGQLEEYFEGNFAQ